MLARLSDCDGCQSRSISGLEAEEAAVRTDVDAVVRAEGERAPEIGEDLPVVMLVTEASGFQDEIDVVLKAWLGEYL